jgi:hypothetical protein
MQFDGSYPQLYNMIADPSETKNLVEEQPQLVEIFRKKLLQWKERVTK